MEKVTRIGISIDKGLLKFFDKVIMEKGYSNRSESINDIIRDYVHKEKKKEVFGVLKIIYDHRKGHYNKNVAELQHEYNCMIVSSTRNYIDKHKCLEIIMIKGVLNRIQIFINKIKQANGIKKVRFFRL